MDFNVSVISGLGTRSEFRDASDHGPLLAEADGTCSRWIGSGVCAGRRCRPLNSRGHSQKMSTGHPESKWLHPCDSTGESASQGECPSLRTHGHGLEDDEKPGGGLSLIPRGSIDAPGTWSRTPRTPIYGWRAGSGLFSISET
jgi:hypothetical protein